ncbi:MAG TPA: Ig-like domain-containing protein, partial [Verrucomicrobiales bacterium]|nr:Ig-like domain-containing protein [Verrucomicrobiales bacterium]
MKTNTTGRLLYAAMVCSTAQVMSLNGLAQGPKSQPKAAAPAPSGQPGVEISDPEVALGSGKDVEVTFSAPMVAESMHGKAVPAGTVLDIKPPLEAELVWQSSRSASLKVNAPVAPGTSFRIALRRDLKDATGKAVSPGPAVTVYGPAFTVEQHMPRWFSMSGADARQPGITLFCNDEVTPEAVAKLAYFRNEAGQTVGVKAEALTVGALGKYPPAFGKWNDRKGGAARDGEDAPDRGPLPPPEAPALSAVRVYPASLLPPGNGWSLIVPKDLANAGGSAKTQKPYIIAYGSIPVMQVAGVEAEPVLDGPRELHVSFNKSIAELKGPEWERFISVEPKPAGLAWEASGRQVTLKG